MACPARLSQWTQEVSTAFAHLSKPHLWGLVLWSAGIALSGVAGITHISALLALVLQEQEQTVFQRLREWYLDAGQKSGNKRRELEVSTCFAPLLGWVLRLWRSEKRQVPLVMDATSLDDFGDQRGHEWVCDPGGLESAPSGTAGVLASVLGRTAGRARESGAARVGSARAG
jgi:hypothetical protein